VQSIGTPTIPKLQQYPPTALIVLSHAPSMIKWMSPEHRNQQAILRSVLLRCFALPAGAQPARVTHVFMLFDAVRARLSMPC
jgi:hypothetical protein